MPDLRDQKRYQERVIRRSDWNEFSDSLESCGWVEAIPQPGSPVLTILMCQELLLPRLELIEGFVFLSEPLVVNAGRRKLAADRFIKDPTVGNERSLDSFNWIDIGHYLYEEDFIVEGMERDDPEGRICEFIFKNTLENLKVGWDLSLKQFGEGRVFEVYISPPEETGGFFGVGFKEDKSKFMERNE